VTGLFLVSEAAQLQVLLAQVLLQGVQRCQLALVKCLPLQGPQNCQTVLSGAQ
jgi:hypothetical protein